MTYCIRLLSPTEEVAAASEVGSALRAEGFIAAVDALPADAGWERLEVCVSGQAPIIAVRSLRQGETNPVDAEIDAFLDLLLDAEEGPAVAQVEDALRRTRQMIALEAPQAFPWAAERTAVDALVEFLVDRTEALIQADGEGFYDREGELLVPVE